MLMVCENHETYCECILSGREAEKVGFEAVPQKGMDKRTCSTLVGYYRTFILLMKIYKMQSQVRLQLKIA